MTEADSNRLAREGKQFLVLLCVVVARDVSSFMGRPCAHGLLNFGLRSLNLPNPQRTIKGGDTFINRQVSALVYGTGFFLGLSDAACEI